MTTASDAAAHPAAAVSVGRARLGVVVFTAGGATLATEIAASRLLAPYFGSSTIVWANIIGLILLYLSLGYWLGGKLADRRPEPRILGRIILAAALAIAVTPFVARPILDVALRGLDAVSVGAVVGSFFAALALFAIPITLLGAVAPFSIRLALVDVVARPGRSPGGSTRSRRVGSIVGTFLVSDRDDPAPRHAADDARLRRPARARGGAPPRHAAGSCSRSSAAGAPRRPAPGRSRRATGSSSRPSRRYQYMQIVERADGSRDAAAERGRRPSTPSGARTRSSPVATGTRFCSCRRSSTGRSSACSIIGNAGGTVARAYGELYPDVEIDGVEIDPEVSEAGAPLARARRQPAPAT